MSTSPLDACMSLHCKLLLSLVLCSFLGLPRLASGTDYYVSNLTGDDTRTGTADKPSGQIGPFRTIARALRATVKGDRVILMNTGVPYHESISIQAAKNSGTAEEPFQIIGNGATLDGSSPIPEGKWEHVVGDVYRFQPEKMAYQQLFKDDRPLTRKRSEKEGAFPKLAALEWCLFDRHIYFRAEKNQLPIFYDLAYATLPVGITLYETRNVIIRDLVVQGYQLDGINAQDNVFRAGLAKVTCRGNGRSGISIGGASRVKLTECLVGNNGAAQVRTEGNCVLEIVNCDLVDDGVVPPLKKLGGRVLGN